MTDADSDQPARSAAAEFAGRLVEHWQEALGTELLGAYLIGSLAHAGFNRRYSDIDLALVTRAGLTAPMLTACERMLSRCPRSGAQVSVFWTDRHFALGRFPPLIAWTIWITRLRWWSANACGRRGPRWKTFSSTCAARHLRAGRAGAQLRRDEVLAPKDHKAYLRTLLYPGRFCYSWTTGPHGLKRRGRAFLSKGQVAGLDIACSKTRWRCRQRAADPDMLFSARSVLPSQIDACAALVSGAGAPRHDG